MASALLAFVQGLDEDKQNTQLQSSRTERHAPLDEVDDDDEDLFGDSDDERTSKRASSLLEVAKQEISLNASTLKEVAKSLKFKENHRPEASIKVLAATMEKEEHEHGSTKAQAHKIQRAFEVTSGEVRADRDVQRNKQLTAGFAAAVAEQQQQYEDDEFEDSAGSAREAAEILAASVAKAKSVRCRSPRCGRKKLSRGAVLNPSMTKLEMQRTMHDKLNAFQLQHLSLTQRRLFLASIAQENKYLEAGFKKKRVTNLEALNELAKDKMTRARQQQKARHKFARFDDDRHCRFTPRLRNSSNKKALRNDFDDEDGREDCQAAVSRRNEDFLRRMEAGERARREQLRRTREEAAYVDRVDKKECPCCGNTQSYSEFTQKRKKCPNCGVLYRSRIVWSDVAKDFITRMEEFQQQCKKKYREQQEESERQDDLACKPENDSEETKKTWEDVRDDFLGRLQLDSEYREMSRAAIWKEIQRECSFSPSITRRAQQLKLDDFDDRVQRDLAERRLRREQLEAQAEHTLGNERDIERRNTSAKSRIAPFQERLRQDIARRRDRNLNNDKFRAEN